MMDRIIDTQNILETYKVTQESAKEITDVVNEFFLGEETEEDVAFDLVCDLEDAKPLLEMKDKYGLVFSDRVLAELGQV